MSVANQTVKAVLMLVHVYFISPKFAYSVINISPYWLARSSPANQNRAH